MTATRAGDELWATDAADGTVLLLIRHGEQSTMLEVDPELSARGRSQATLLADRLRTVPIDRVVSSPMRRAVQTATPLAAALGLTVDVHPELDEVRMSEEVVRERFMKQSVRAMEPDPERYAETVLGAIEVVPRFHFGGEEGSESSAALRDRATSALQDVVTGHSARTVAVFTHGAFINAALSSWLGISRHMWFVPWHTGVTVLRVTRGALVPLSVNDASHLAPDDDVLGVVTRGRSA
jgi:broad specificity phosphatase PhoE